jgi:hypothetical protein
MRHPGFQKLVVSNRPVFRPDGDWYPPSGIPRPTLVDLTGDGRPEIVASLPGGRVYAVGPDGHRLWTATYARSSAKTFASEVVAADLNKDGTPELVFGTYSLHRNAGHLVVLSAQGKKLSETRLKHQGRDGNGIGVPAAPSIADLTGDGTLEIVLTTFDHGIDVYTVPGSGHRVPALAHRSRQHAAQRAWARQPPPSRPSPSGRTSTRGGRRVAPGVVVVGAPSLERVQGAVGDPHPPRVAQAVRRDGQRDLPVPPVEVGRAAVRLVRLRVGEEEVLVLVPCGTLRTAYQGKLGLGGGDRPVVLLLGDPRIEAAVLRGHHQVGAERDPGAHDVSAVGGRLVPGRGYVAEVLPAQHVASRVARSLRGSRSRGREPHRRRSCRRRRTTRPGSATCRAG